MVLDPKDIKRLIQDGIPDADVSVSDLRGDGRHYAAYVVSPVFRDRTRVEQHRMVYKTLEHRFGEDLEALAIQTAVPEG